MTGNRTERDIPPGQEVIIDRFRPEDAEGVTALFISVYGEGYPIRTYVEPERLRRENAAGTIISSVARTPRGEIVGHNALFRSAPCPGIYESGAGLVHRNYRGGKGIFTALVAHGQALAEETPAVEAIFGEAVCNHVFSQKMTHGLGWRTMALEVDLMPAAAYAREGSATGRVSSILDFKTIRPRTTRAYLPAGYEAPLRFLYEGLDDERVLLPAEGKPPPRTKSRVESQYFAFAQVARLAVWDVGEDFREVFTEKEREVLERGAMVFQAWVNTGQPWCGWAVDILREKGYFFGGVLPRWFDTDGLLMIRTRHRPSWEGMEIYHERARKFAAIVREDWERRGGGE